MRCEIDVFIGRETKDKNRKSIVVGTTPQSEYTGVSTVYLGLPDGPTFYLSKGGRSPEVREAHEEEVKFFFDAIDELKRRYYNGDADAESRF